MPESRGRRALWSLFRFYNIWRTETKVSQGLSETALDHLYFGKERGVRDKLRDSQQFAFYRKKWVFSLHKFISFLKADSSQNM